MKKKRINAGFIFRIILLVIIAIIIISPIFFIILSSFRTEGEFNRNPIGLPTTLSFKAYERVFEVAGIPSAFLNSAIIALFSLLGQIFFGSLAAYALTKMNFKRSNIFLNIYLFPIIFSIQMVILPVFIIFKYLNLINTHLGAIIIYIGTGLPITVFILAKFLKTIPDSLCEAAQVEGASHFQIYYKIILPIIKAPIAAITVINGLGVWNDFFVPLMFFTNGKIKTLPLGIFLFNQDHFVKWTYVSADIVITILPLIILYVALQRFVIKGVVEGAVKG